MGWSEITQQVISAAQSSYYHSTHQPSCSSLFVCALAIGYLAGVLTVLVLQSVRSHHLRFVLVALSSLLIQPSATSTPTSDQDLTIDESRRATRRPKFLDEYRSEGDGRESQVLRRNKALYPVRERLDSFR